MVKTALHAIAVAAAALLLGAGSAHADSVIYTFAGTGAAISNPFVTIPAQQLGFQLTVSTFINPPFPVGNPPNPGSFVSFTCAQLDTSTNCRPTGTTVIFSNQGTGSFTADLQFIAANSVTYAFQFPTGSFGVPGTYNSGVTANVGTLTVTAVPESSASVLLLAGISVIVLRARLKGSFTIRSPFHFSRGGGAFRRIS